MNKIAILKSSNLPSWKSCQSISKNILAAWNKVPSIEKKVFHFDNNFEAFKSAQLVFKIKSYKPDVIVFIEHSPCPASLLDRIFLAYEKEGIALPKLIFHLYGDFSLQSPLWVSARDSLAKFDSLFLCASSVQQKFVSQFVKNKEFVMELPFPVDTEMYKPLKDKCEKSSQKTFLYTGRVTIQKNVFELVQSFKKYNYLFETKDELKIIGPYDDMNNPYLGKVSFPLSYCTQLEQIWDENCVYLGAYEQEKLNSIYQHSDYYLNLSTYNDEDYGMAVIEALSCGLPVVLSAWGGFSSFKEKLGDYVSLIPVDFSDDSKISFDSKFLIKELHRLSSSEFTSKKKAELHEKVRSIYSINAISKQITEFLETASYGKILFNEEFIDFSHSFVNSPLQPFRAPVKCRYNDVYKKWYNCYQVSV